MPAVIVASPSPPPPLPLSSSLLQPLDTSIVAWHQQQRPNLQLSSTTLASHWLILAAPVVVISSLLVAVFQCLGRTRRAPRQREFSATDIKRHTTPAEPLSEKLAPEPERKSEPEPEPEPEPRHQPTPAPPRLRMRVYHLRDRWPASPAAAVMTADTTMGALGSSSSGSSSSNSCAVGGPTDMPAESPTARTPTGNHLAATIFSLPTQQASPNQAARQPSPPQQRFPHPPPLPLSTSTIAFHRQMGGPGSAASGEVYGSSATAAASGTGIPSPLADADAQMSFIHQPNPDYTSDVDVDLGFGFSEDASVVALGQGAGATEPAEASAGVPRGTGASSPLLSFAALKGVTALPLEANMPREMGVQGEIISVLDDAGAGWSRHTRVYGGGVCLACLAAESGGGVYGDSVPLGERR